MRTVHVKRDLSLALSLLALDNTIIMSITQQAEVSSNLLDILSNSP